MDVDQHTAFSTFPTEQGGLESLIYDGLHPNEKGYQLLAEGLNNKILVIPYPPEGLQVKRMRRDNTIQLSWEVNTKITAATQLAVYHIYRKTSEKSAYTWIGQTNATVTNFTDNGTSPNMDYIYMIRAANSDSIQGPPTDPVTVGIGDPFPPTGVQSQFLTNRPFLYRKYVNG